MPSSTQIRALSKSAARELIGTDIVPAIAVWLSDQELTETASSLQSQLGFDIESDEALMRTLRDRASRLAETGETAGIPVRGHLARGEVLLRVVAAIEEDGALVGHLFAAQPFVQSKPDEDLVAAVASRLLQADVSELDIALEAALEMVVAHTGAASALLLLVVSDGERRLAYASPSTAADRLERLPPDAASWGALQELLASREAARGVAERHIESPDNPYYIVALPLAEELVAVLVIEKPGRCPTVDADRLRLVGQLIQRALGRRQSAWREARRIQRLRDQQDSLVELARSPDVVGGDLPAALRTLTEVAAWAIGTRRATVWTVEGDDWLIQRDRFDIAAIVHEGGARRSWCDLVERWSSLGREMLVVDQASPRAALSAAAHEALSELAEGDAQAVLIAPLRTGRGSRGLIVLEHVGDPRHFSTDDRSYVASLASLAATAIEIAERRRTEERYRSLVEQSPVAIFFLVDDVVAYANRAALELLGAESVEGLGALVDQVRGQTEPPSSVRDGESKPPDAADIATEERWQRLDGGRLLVDVTRLETMHLGRVATQVTARDVTERRELSAQLMAVDRMVSMGSLAAAVGHEINNPLSYVLGNIDHTIDELDALGLPPEHVLRELVADTQEGATRIRDVVRDLRTFSRSNRDVRERVDLGAVVESAARMAKNEIRHRARLIKDYEQAPVLYANDGRLRQLVLNLLVNAAQSIVEGHVADNEIRIRLSETERDVLLVVSDTGSGLPDDVRAQIFEPFFTTKPAGLGTGLGLTICQQIVQSHHGTIDVASEAGKGTAFTVKLPKLDPDEEMRSREQPTGEAGTSAVARRRVLVVDDEPIICRTVVRLLSPQHDVSTATSGREALERLREDPGFDLVLCDIMMPDLTGMDLLETMSEELPELAERFVFVTGGAFTPRAKEFLARMSDRVLQKPLDGRRLRQFVQAHLAHQRVRAS